MKIRLSNLSYPHFHPHRILNTVIKLTLTLKYNYWLDWFFCLQHQLTTINLNFGITWSVTKTDLIKFFIYIVIKILYVTHNCNKICCLNKNWLYVRISWQLFFSPFLPSNCLRNLYLRIWYETSFIMKLQTQSISTYHTRHY